MSYRAVYRDSQGRTYSAPVKLHNGEWVMVTSEGFAQINLHFDDDSAGRLEFVEYRDEPDARLHVDGNAFRALQDAGARATAAYQTQREQQRREMLDMLNQPNARKIAEARAINTELAQRWNPKQPEPIPPPAITKENIGLLAEEARWRKKKIEPES